MVTRTVPTISTIPATATATEITTPTAQQQQQQQQQPQKQSRRRSSEASPSYFRNVVSLNNNTQHNDHNNNNNYTTTPPLPCLPFPAAAVASPSSGEGGKIPFSAIPSLLSSSPAAAAGDISRNTIKVSPLAPTTLTTHAIQPTPFDDTTTATTATLLGNIKEEGDTEKDNNNDASDTEEDLLLIPIDDYSISNNNSNTNSNNNNSNTNNLRSPQTGSTTAITTATTTRTPITTNIRSRKKNPYAGGRRRSGTTTGTRRGRLRRKKSLSKQRNPAGDALSSTTATRNNKSTAGCCSASSSWFCSCWCCHDPRIVRSTLSCMNIIAKLLAWSTVLASVSGVVWYSYELKQTGKDPHLILWNSAAAFVLLGFPISIYGIVMHLANYNQPNSQMYIVRILWMVPMYSLQSWLGLRFKYYSIYFETLRDLYESYVLYSFFQYLIEVLGGEEALILMLKDKSPTRGVHIWGFQFCLKPWLMGQPVRKTFMDNWHNTTNAMESSSSLGITAAETSMINFGGPPGHNIQYRHNQLPIAKNTSSSKEHQHQQLLHPINKPLKRVHWTSPFFLYCKFGVLQYVLLKFISAIVVFILEPYNLYKEGNFTYKGGYLYTSLIINISQTVALYCLIFFYYACKNELTPIRAVGKFLSVKLLVFATWWQSLLINILLMNGFISEYQSNIMFTSALSSTNGDENGNDDGLGHIDSVMDPSSLEPLSALNTTSTTVTTSSDVIEYSPEDVAKALQNYLICIEMFVFAIVHIFVFPHSEYSPEAVEARARALNQKPNKHWNKRLGRKWKEYDNKSAWSGTTNDSSRGSVLSTDIELFPLMNTSSTGNKSSAQHNTASSNNDYRDHVPSPLFGSNNNERRKDLMDDDDLRIHPLDTLDEMSDVENQPLLLDELEDDQEYDDDDDTSIYSDDDDCSDGNIHDTENRITSEAEQQQAMMSASPSSGTSSTPSKKKKNFFSALIDSAIPQDLRDDTVGIIKGDYVVERKTLLHHAATSDSYDLFSRVPRRQHHQESNKEDL